MWLFLLSVALALSISFLCSLMEAVLLSLRPSQVAAITAQRPRIGAVWQRLKEEIERPIAAILILNTAAHTIGASVAGAQFHQLYGDEWIWAFSLVFTFLMLQFTEILPKNAGVRYNRQMAFWIAKPLALLVYVMRPVAALVHLLNLPFGGARPRTQPLSTMEEIAALAGLARLSRQISSAQERIIRRGSRLSRIKVREIMRPRVEIEALDIQTPPDEVAGAVVMSGFSRVPVYEGDLDHIVGFVYNKDLLLELQMRRPIELPRLLRPVLLVPETLRLDGLLERFRDERTQMAIVLDEYGGTEGLVTVEDVLEELVGAIHDEHRSGEQPEIVRRSPTSWLVLGAASYDDLLEAVGRPELHAAAPRDVSTVGGLVQTLLDRVPAVGDRTTWQGLWLEVAEMDGLRVEWVLVSLVEEPSAAEG